MNKIRPLSPELATKVKIAWKEDDELIEAKLTEIKEWLLKQPHLKHDMSDQLILSFLRGCKYKMDVAKSKIDMYQTMRTVCPEVFQNRNPTNTQLAKWIKTGSFLPLVDRSDPVGPVIMFYRCNYNANWNILDGVKYAFLLFDMLLNENDNLTVSGLILVADMAGITFAHILSFTPNVLIMMAKIFFNAFPIRLKAVCFYNVPTGFKPVIDILKLLSPTKIRKRYFVYNNMENAYKHTAQENLPNEYGGEAGTLDELTSFWEMKIHNGKDWMIDTEKLCSNESLRPDGPKTSKSVFSICSIM